MSIVCTICVAPKPNLTDRCDRCGPYAGPSRGCVPSCAIFDVGRSCGGLASQSVGCLWSLLGRSLVGVSALVVQRDCFPADRAPASAPRDASRVLAILPQVERFSARAASLSTDTMGCRRDRCDIGAQLY